MFNSFNPTPLKRRKIALYKKIYLSDLIVIIFGFILSLVTIFSVYATSIVLAFTVGLIPAAIAFLCLIPVDDDIKLWNAMLIGIAFPFQKKIYTHRQRGMLIPYKEIKDGVLVTKNHGYIKFIKIEGFNFMTLTDQESHNAIDGFRNVLREIESSFSLYSIDMPIDYDDNIEYLNSLKTKENEKIWDVSSKTLKVLSETTKSTQKEIFLVLYNSSFEDLQQESKKISSSLIHSNLNAQLINDESEISFLLKKRYGTENEIEELDNLITGASKFDGTTIKMNGKYSRILMVNKYPFSSNLGWLYPLMNIPNVSFVMNFEKYDLKKAINKIDAAASEAHGQLQTTYRQSEVSKSQNEAELMAALSNQIHQENEIVFSTHSYFIVTADSKSNLRAQVNKLKGTLMTQQIRIASLAFKQKEAFENSLPKPSDKDLPKKQLPEKLDFSFKKTTSIEIPSSSLANGFPFHKDKLDDKEGIYLGYSRNGENIFFNPFMLSGMRKNHNINVLGSSGGGKTTFVSKIIKDAWLKGGKIIIIDPQGEYGKLTESLKGTYSDCGASSNNTNRINPLEFFRTSESGISISEHIQFLESFFKVVFPEMNDIEWAELNILISNLYRSKKISSKTKSNSFPVLKDLSIIVDKEFAKSTKTNKEPHRQKTLYGLSSYLKRFQDPKAPESVMWNGVTNFKIDDSRLFTFDIHNIGASQNDRLINAQYHLIIKFTFSQMIINREINNKKNIEQKMFILVDEAHKLINEKLSAGIEFLVQMSKTIRKFGGGLIFTTQNMADLLGGSEYVKQKTSAIINNAQYSFYFQMNSDDLGRLQKMTETSSHKFSTEEKDYIVSAKQGSFLMSLSPIDRKMVSIDIPEEERFIWKDENEI